MLAIFLAIWNFLVAFGPLLAAVVAALFGIIAVLWELVAITATIAAIIGIFELIFNPAGRPKLAQGLANLVAGGIDAVSSLVTTLQPAARIVMTDITTAITTHGPSMSAELTGPFQQFAHTVLEAQRAVFASAGESTKENALDNAALAFKVAFGAGMSSAGVSTVFEALLPEKLNTLNAYGPMLAKLAGFDEVAAEVLGPLYRAAFGQSLEYAYRAQFKPDLPSEGDGVNWHARRFIDDTQLKKIFDVSGLKSEWETPYINAAYRSVQPRALANLYQDVPIDEAQMRSLLERAGLLPEQIPIMIDAFKLNSVKNVRNQYLGAVLTAAERGTLTPAEVESDLTELNFSDDAKHWVRLTIATRKLEQLAELYRKGISADYEFGTITDAQYVPALEAIGIAQADADAHFAIDSARKHGREAAAAARALAREQAAVMRAETRAALLNYQVGNIDAGALTLALTAIGQPLGIVASAVDVAVLRKQASQRLVFGKLTTEPEAILLRERVAAIKTQVIRKLLDPAAALAQLEAFGIPSSNAIDMVAQWQAQALKVFTPVI